MKRLSEMTDLELIKEIDDDALAREISKRITQYQFQVTNREQILEERILKLQGINI